MIISLDKKLVISQARCAIGKYIGMINGKMRGLSLESKEHILQAYAKSLLNYFGAPLLAAGYISTKVVEKWEE